MKNKVIFTMLVHQLIYASVLTLVFLTIGYSLYNLFSYLGVPVANKPLWGTRIILVFLQMLSGLIVLFVWKFKKRGMMYEDYYLELSFKKELADRNKCMSLVKRQLFNVESETSTEIAAFRIVGRFPKRRQTLNIKFEKEMASFVVRVENTIYPIDYFSHNYHVKLSFLNNL